MSMCKSFHMPIIAHPYGGHNDWSGDLPICCLGPKRASTYYIHNIVRAFWTKRHSTQFPCKWVGLRNDSMTPFCLKRIRGEDRKVAWVRSNRWCLAPRKIWFGGYNSLQDSFRWCRTLHSPMKAVVYLTEKCWRARQSPTFHISTSTDGLPSDKSTFKEMWAAHLQRKTRTYHCNNVGADTAIRGQQSMPLVRGCLHSVIIQHSPLMTRQLPKSICSSYYPTSSQSGTTYFCDDDFNTCHGCWHTHK